MQYVSFKKSDYKDSKAKFPKKEWDISTDRWNALGFYRYMNLLEAKVRARQLNTQLEIKKQEERLLKLKETNRNFQKRFDSVLPEEFVNEFEMRFMRKRDSEVDRGRRRTSRAILVWKAAQKLIVAIGIESTGWFYSSHEIYGDIFLVRKLAGYFFQYHLLKVMNVHDSSILILIKLKK